MTLWRLTGGFSKCRLSFFTNPVSELVRGDRYRKNNETVNENFRRVANYCGQTDEEMALLMLQSRAAQKLLAANGNESVLTAEEKDSISHRGKALRLLAKKLEEII